MPGENENTNESGGERGSGFTPITSQDQLNRLIGERINKVESRFADYDDLKAKAEKLDQVEQANLTEIERERKARETAEAELAKYRHREQVQVWAKDVAKDAPDLVPLLRGETREELEEHFKQLLALTTKAAPRRTATPPGKPTVGDGGGSRAAAALRQLRQG